MTCPRYQTRPRKRIVLPPSLAREYGAGATCHELAERHGCSHATVYNTLLDRGCTMRRTGNRGPRNDGPMQRHTSEIRACRKQGASLSLIAGWFGCSISTVHRITQ